MIDGEIRVRVAGEEAEVSTCGAARRSTSRLTCRTAAALEACSTIDVFHPPRQDWLDGSDAYRARSEARARRSPRARHRRVEGARLRDRQGARRARARASRSARGPRTRCSAAAEALGAAHAQAADVTDPEQVRDFVAPLGRGARRGRLPRQQRRRRAPGQLRDPDRRGLGSRLDVKLFSLIRCCREVLPHMRAAGGGRIVNIGAVYARYPDPTFFATSVIRAAGNSFTKTLALEVAKDNMLVNARQHRLRRHAAVGQHPPAAGSRRAARRVLRHARRGTRCRSAASACPTRCQGSSRSCSATGRATSPARRSTSPAAWAGTSRSAARHTWAA